MTNVMLGRLGVLVALAGASAGVLVGLVGLLGKRPALLKVLRWYAAVVLAGTTTAVIAMERALITRDFTVEYVSKHGSSKTPPLFNFATMWSALEGSILLWAIILAIYIALVAFRYRNRWNDPLVAWAMVTLFVIALFFAALLVGPANPFREVTVPPGFDGTGPNPLLQNHILVAFHPPMLYLGYVGFSVPFAFAIAALITGRLGEGWLLATRRWTLISWAALTGGIVLGAWWSYEVLGWGGYWAWDPVENASFLPWLTATAYVHSVLVQERRGMLRVWNLSLLCSTFALTILGTFLTRSGVVNSVHAFSNSAMGPTLLGFFAFVTIVSVGLIGWRGDMLRSPNKIRSLRSREAAFLANNLVFALFAFIVLLGTVYPLIAEAINGQQLSVGEPYFNRISVPIGIALLTLMGVAPVLPWTGTTGDLLSERLRWPAWAGAATALVAVLAGARGLVPVMVFTLGGFAAGTALRQLIPAIAKNGWRGLVGRLNGGMIVHLGTIIIAVALASSGSYDHRGEFVVKPGESATVASHTVKFVDSQLVDTDMGPQYRINVLIDGAKHVPKVTQYASTGQIVGTPSVKVSPLGDTYVAVPGVPDSKTGSITMRVIVLPMVAWLWFGGVVMVIGTLLAFVPGASTGSRRRAVATEPAPETEAPEVVS